MLESPSTISSVSFSAGCSVITLDGGITLVFGASALVSFRVVESRTNSPTVFTAALAANSSPPPEVRAKNPKISDIRKISQTGYTFQ